MRSARLALLGLLVASPAAAQQTALIGQPTQATIFTCEPWGCWNSDQMTGYQALYDGSIFNTNRTIDIFGLEFFRAGSYLPHEDQDYDVGSSLGSALVRFSVTRRTPLTMSAYLPDNFGSHTQVFFAQFVFGIQNTGYLPGGPGVFFGSLVGAPFRYNPHQGNLLIDIMLDGSTTHVDNEAVRDPRCSTANSYRGYDDPNDPANSYPPSSGTYLGFCMVTKFTYNVVPEPSTTVLLATGLATLAVVTWRRRRA
jgi:hypothetical protein